MFLKMMKIWIWRIDEKYYLEELQKRIQNHPTHLKNLQNFLNFCAMIKKNISG